MDSKTYFHFWKSHVRRLYMVRSIGQVLCEMLKTPRGFTLSVLDANLIFLESLANFGYITSKFFHRRASVGCWSISSFLCFPWCQHISRHPESWTTITSCNLSQACTTSPVEGFSFRWAKHKAVFSSSIASSGKVFYISCTELDLHLGKLSNKAYSFLLLQDVDMQWFTQALIFCTPNETRKISFFARDVLVDKELGFGNKSFKWPNKLWSYYQTNHFWPSTLEVQALITILCIPCCIPLIHHINVSSLPSLTSLTNPIGTSGLVWCISPLNQNQYHRNHRHHPYYISPTTSITILPDSSCISRWLLLSDIFVSPWWDQIV